MDANIRNARADRLHALFVRNGRRFRDVAFAARLAFDRLEQLAPTHPDYRAIRAVADRAAASMATLNARSMRLARLQIAAVGIGAALAHPATAVASDEWTDSQVTKAGALAVLTTADWAQTRNIARHPTRWHEANPLMGKHPSMGTVDRHFVGSMVAGALVLNALPTRYRDWALNAGLVIEAGCVGNNLRLGIGIKF